MPFRRRARPIKAEELDDNFLVGWRVHENARTWITQVDAKAAAALAIEAVILGFAISLAANPDVLSNLTPLARGILAAGIFMLALSVSLAILVIVPRIKLREPDPERRGFLYFGHLRHWKKEELGMALIGGKVDAVELSDQVIKLSEIAWRKHVILKWSLYALLGGLALVGGMYLILILGLYPERFGVLATDASKAGGK